MVWAEEKTCLAMASNLMMSYVFILQPSWLITCDAFESHKAVSYPSGGIVADTDIISSKTSFLLLLFFFFLNNETTVRAHLSGIFAFLPTIQRHAVHKHVNVTFRILADKRHPIYCVYSCVKMSCF